MTWLASKRYVLGLGLIGGSGWLTAAGCGSSDPKKAVPSAEAGAAGEGGGGRAGAAAGGAPSEPVGGVAGESAGGVAGESAGGVAGESSVGGAPAGAGPGGGAGGEPTALCLAEGSVTNLALNPEPIYQGCRGALLRVPFEADLAADTFTCCGVSTSEPAFTLPLGGISDQDGGGELTFLVPDDAALGSYALSLTCQTQPNDQAIALEISDTPAPQVVSITTLLQPTGVMQITGQNLLGVTYISASGSTGSFECAFQDADKTATGIACTFPNGITPSSDAEDLYTLHVLTESCGYAASAPTFLVTTVVTQD